MANLPLEMNQKQYRIFRDKLSQYEGVDISAYESRLEEWRKQGRQQELARMAGRIGRSNRSGLMQMLQQLKEGGFSQEEIDPVQQKVEDQIRLLDEQAIDNICKCHGRTTPLE